jgi:hypothetical protein
MPEWMSSSGRLPESGSVADALGAKPYMHAHAAYFLPFNLLVAVTSKAERGLDNTARENLATVPPGI